MRYLLLSVGLAALLALAACQSPPAYDVTPPAGVAAAEVRFLGARTITVWESDSGDLHEHAVVPLTAAELALEADWSEVYRGSERKAAKISIADASIETFESIYDFLDSVASDEEMVELDISTDTHSARIEDEERNVSIEAFILASNKPDDNDYHVIIGNDDTDPTLLMNVEVSGLPLFPRDDAFTTNDDAERLERVREFYQSRMGSLLPTGPYKRYSPGIPVRVTGSIMYDASHAPGEIGPAGLRPETAWEIHPVTFIWFHDED